MGFHKSYNYPIHPCASNILDLIWSALLGTKNHYPLSQSIQPYFCTFYEVSSSLFCSFLAAFVLADLFAFDPAPWFYTSHQGAKHLFQSKKGRVVFLMS